MLNCKALIRAGFVSHQDSVPLTRRDWVIAKCTDFTIKDKINAKKLISLKHSVRAT